MVPTQVEVQSFTVTGISVRTSNQEEMDSETAKIGELWQNFFAENIQEQVSGRNSDSLSYGIYYDYESDASGPYSALAGVQGAAVGTALEQVTIQSGTYLAFEASGPMPQTLLETWGTIWDYFQNNNSYKRRYGTDYESYASETEVVIYVGVK